jgi:ATP-binding cassette, subfamily B, bacterial
MAKRKKKAALTAEEKRPLNKTALRKLFSLFQFMLPYKGLFILGLFSLFISTFTILAFPHLAGELFNIASGKPTYFSTINEGTVALLLVLVLQSIFSFIRVYTFSIVSEKGIGDLRKRIYQKIIWLPISFFDSRRVGELMSRLTSDVSTLQDTFSFTLAEALRQMLTLVFGTAFLFYLSPQLTTFMLLTFPVIVVSAIIFGKFIRKLARNTQDKLAETNVIIEESLQSISVVKAFTNEGFQTQRYNHAVDEVVSIATRVGRFRALFVSFIILVIFGGIVAVAWFGASLVQGGALDTGGLLSFVIYTFIIGFSIQGLGEIYSQLQRSVGASERVLEILQEEDESHTYAGKNKLNGSIEFQQVNFAYPTRKEVGVLRGLDFSIRPGEKIALVGQSGAGKSTIINLLMRFYPTSSGQILIDGQDINSYNLSAYRENLGIVPQEIILFGGTIADNIAYGRPGATESEIREAARKANALEFIETFPEGFRTLVGERGIKLSGGQRQRVAIARAILKDPAILILDEATSSLDAKSELLVQEALHKLMEGRTSIIIAHRLSTIKKVDRIFVIQDGKLAEMGSHTELSHSDNGIYSNLLKLQVHGYDNGVR